MNPAQEQANTRPGVILTLLFLANLMNFFDRTIPAIVVEPIRFEWGLSDLQLGMLTAAFTVVYAIAGLPLGRLADRHPRRLVMGWGLVVWSGFTAVNGLAWSYASFFLGRMGVGIGEASYAPAANSLIGDLYPSAKRARATGIFMLGLPLGLVLAFFTVGAMVEAFGSWRAPFFIAAVPGLLLAIWMFFIREPRRGASEAVADGEALAKGEAMAESEAAAGDGVATGADVEGESGERAPIRRLLRIPTLRWLILSGVTMNFASYAGNGFLVPMLQRYFGLALGQAAMLTGCMVGITGLIGLVAGGFVADALHQRSERGRLLFGAGSLLLAAGGTGVALTMGAASLTAFAWLFGLGWLMLYNYYTCVYPAIQDVVEPRLRATAVAVYFAGMYLLGGAFGPVVVGALSDSLARRAMEAAGETVMQESFKASGLHDSMFLVPVTLLATAIFVYLAARRFPEDARAMERRQAEGASI